MVILPNCFPYWDPCIYEHDLTLRATEEVRVMSPASVILMLLLNLSRLSHQCNKAVVEHKDDHRDVIEERKDDHENDFSSFPRVLEKRFFFL